MVLVAHRFLAFLLTHTTYASHSRTCFHGAICSVSGVIAKHDRKKSVIFLLLLTHVIRFIVLFIFRTCHLLLSQRLVLFCDETALLVIGFIALGVDTHDHDDDGVMILENLEVYR